MKITINAVYNGKSYLPLIEGADTTVYKSVDVFEFEMRESNVLTIAAADAEVSSIAPKEVSGQRSLRAEERLYPLGYAKVHVISMTKNGEVISPLTLTALGEVGFAVLNHLYALAEAPSINFLAEAPPSTPKDGEMDTTKTSASSRKS